MGVAHGSWVEEFPAIMDRTGVLFYKRLLSALEVLNMVTLKTFSKSRLTGCAQVMFRCGEIGRKPVTNQYAWNDSAASKSAAAQLRLASMTRRISRVKKAIEGWKSWLHFGLWWLKLWYLDVSDIQNSNILNFHLLVKDYSGEEDWTQHLLVPALVFPFGTEVF